MSCRQFRIRGLVQGVGFRPYVWRLAKELALSGWVRNDASGVTLAVDGPNSEKFIARLAQELPPLARIDAIEEIDALPTPAVTDRFLILDSTAGAAMTTIGPDAAICPHCCRDIFDPDNRRWRYAFTTCTHCGPRYTVSTGIPYDRARTSLASFPLCPACSKEYTDPADRRFHAETTCCPDCGPQLRWLAGHTDSTPDSQTNDPLAAAIAALRQGLIVAIKGLGGFHLACDADNPAAVAELRRRKGRDAKPFALMALNAASVADIADIGADEEALLADRAAPIVLCAKGKNELPGIAPHLAEIGLMRPATPLHLLLWHEAAGRPAGTDWLKLRHPLRLVMTSANPGGEPLVIANDEAQQRLAGAETVADAFLLHNRDIVIRCDDSLLRSTASGPQFLRRARGYAPLPIRLAHSGAPVLALGGYLKNTICVLRGDEAFLSPHVGSLDNAATLGFLEETVAHLLAVLAVRPAAIAHDAHPDYPSTQLAQRLADAWDIPAMPVPHHAAHLAAIAAEYRCTEPLLGLALDGVGLGTDGGLWGGELLQLTPDGHCRRLGHLRPLPLPGGDRTAREPWRMAVAALHALGRSAEIPAWLASRHPRQALGPLLQMLDRGLNCPPSSSLGRIFDAAAGLLGLSTLAAYEGQAAMELEALARRQIATHGLPSVPTGAYTLSAPAKQPRILDLLPLLAILADCPTPAEGAALFHMTLAQSLEKWLLSTVDRGNVKKFAISGGCAQNTLLTSLLRTGLAKSGCTLLEARQAPANDGGLALGQACILRQQLAQF